MHLDERLEHRHCHKGAQAGLRGLGLAAAWNGRRAPRGQLRYEVGSRVSRDLYALRLSDISSSLGVSTGGIEKEFILAGKD